ncbi:S24 family peptidase [Sphingobacterium humi]|uniref:Peptidase S24/S26A/S26B/S26C domain-containing protein n=1 Tax=Sphingobacterium humi TaxID=1796905 RepID=A0A6N8L7F2_9SPHI|nr:S24 family peptidase [Sphingobacterium humi]MVZ63662.1 hypothetical protein [Sphingobacterium humi]
MNKIIINNDLFFNNLVYLISKDNIVRFCLKGKSMQPFIYDGSMVTLTSVQDNSMRIGNVVLAKWNGTFILHRILFKYKETIYLFGDGNLMQIEKVSKEDVLAILKCYENKNGLNKDITILSKFLSAIWFLLRPLRILIKKSVTS